MRHDNYSQHIKQSGDKVQYVTRIRKVYLVHNKREEYGHVYEMSIR